LTRSNTLDPELRTLIDEVNGPVPLDPGAAMAVAELLIDHGGNPERNEKDLFAVIASISGPYQKENASQLVRSVVTLRPKLAKPLERSLRHKGRCPTSLRPSVIDGLGPRTHRVLPPPPKPVTRTEKSIELLLNPQTTNLHNLPALYDALATCAHADEVRVRVADFVYASALAAVATWLRAHQQQATVISRDPYSEQYLQRIGFYDALYRVRRPPRHDTQDWAVSLTPIEAGTSPMDLADQILEIVEIFVAPPRDQKESLGILLGEVLENVTAHARITSVTSAGFVVAQLYPKKFKLGITVADSGIGIKRSFLEGGRPEFQTPARPDEDFIDLAMQMLVTSKTERHKGYGMYLLKELIARNGGTFSVTSGEASVTGFRRRRQTVTQTARHLGWQGTIVNMIIDTTNPLPIHEVYNTLPLPEGFDPGDLIEGDIFV
jgi:hypothetical protein